MFSFFGKSIQNRPRIYAGFFKYIFYSYENICKQIWISELCQIFVFGPVINFLYERFWSLSHVLNILAYRSFIKPLLYLEVGATLFSQIFLRSNYSFNPPFHWTTQLVQCWYECIIELVKISLSGGRKLIYWRECVMPFEIIFLVFLFSF